MKFIANVVWFIIGGLVSFLLYTILGVILCITIIGIPFGLQFFKLGQLMLAPFGKEVVYGGKGGSFILNMIWLILFGWGTALISLVLGLICCVTIVGIPVGVQVIKFAKLALMPFGTEIRKKSKNSDQKPAKQPAEQPAEKPIEQPTQTPEQSTEQTTPTPEQPVASTAEPPQAQSPVAQPEPQPEPPVQTQPPVQPQPQPPVQPESPAQPEPPIQPQPPTQPQSPATPPQPTV